LKTPLFVMGASLADNEQVADESRRGWPIARDLHVMPLIYWVPIVLALIFPGWVALDVGAPVALVWWLIAALGALSLARRRRGGRIALTVGMLIAASLLAALWLGGQLMWPALLALLVIDLGKEAFRVWPKRSRSAN